MRNTHGSSALSEANVGSDFASTTNRQASTLLLKIQDISPYRDTLHLQEQMEAKQEWLFDEIVYLSPAFPMFHQVSRPIIFGMRLRKEDKPSMEAITAFKSLIAQGVDWVHIVKCMALPSAYRNYQVSSGILRLSASANVAVDGQARKRIGAGLESWFALEERLPCTSDCSGERTTPLGEAQVPLLCR